MTIQEITLSNKEKFSLELSRIKVQHNLNTIDAIIFFCDQNECDVVEIVSAIDRTIKEELWEDALKERYILAKPLGDIFK